MRKTLLMTILLGIYTQVGAQQLSAGYKTGINNWMRINTTHKGPILSEVKDGARISWDNETFVRYQTKGNWAFEAGIGYTKRDMDGMGYYTGCFGNRSTTWEDINMSYTELNLGVQYKIKLPACLNKCPLLNRMSNYIGVTVSPHLQNFVIENTYSDYDAALIMQSEPQRRNNALPGISAGINHTIVYNITRQFNAVSTMSLKYIPDGRYNYTSNTRAGLSLGASYYID